jgi:hypothetical protein
LSGIVDRFDGLSSFVLKNWDLYGEKYNLKITFKNSRNVKVYL